MRTEISCPNCGKSNSESADTCINCAALLKKPTLESGLLEVHLSMVNDEDGSSQGTESLPDQSPAARSGDNNMEKSNPETSLVEPENEEYPNKGTDAPPDQSSDESADGNTNTNEVEKQKDSGNEEQSPKRNGFGNQVFTSGRDTNVTNITNILNKPSKEDQFRLNFKEVKYKEKNKARSIFDPPIGYDEKLQHILSSKQHERIYFIVGDEHSGKYTTAINLGLEIADHLEWEDTNIYRITSSIPDFNSLSLYFRRSVVEEKSFYIITDIFSQGLNKRDFTKSVLWGLKEVLEEKNSYIIFTTEKEASHFEYSFEIPISTKNDLGECFRKYFNWWMDEENPDPITAEVINSNLQDFKENYKFPAQISAFFVMINNGEVGLRIAGNKNLQGDLSEAGFDDAKDDEKIKVALEQIAQIARLFGKPNQELTQVWFSGLSPNARLFAMLSVLIDGIEYYSVYDIYSRFVNQLRVEEIEYLVEPRQIGMDTLLTEIKAEVGEDGRIHFQDRAYLEQINSQLHNWFPLLWSLVDLLIAIARNYKKPEYWELRRAIGKAIARLGVHHRFGFKDKLTEIAKDENGPIVVIAGYAMEEACELGVENHAPVIETLNEWIEAKTIDDGFDLEWAVASSVWRIYGGLQQILDEQSDERIIKQIQETLNKVSLITTHLASRISTRFIESNTNDVDDFIVDLLTQENQSDKILNKILATIGNLKAVIYAIRQIMLLDHQNTFAILESWLKSGEPGLLLVAIFSIQNILEINSHEETRMPSDQRFKTLEFLQPVLKYVQFSELKNILIENIFYSASTWQDLPDWKEKVLCIFTPIFNRAIDEDLDTLVSVVIRNWLDVDNNDIQKAGISLITRAYAIAGTPMDLTGGRRAVLALDTSREAHLSRMSLIGTNLYPRLQSRIQTEIIFMGKSGKVSWEHVLPTEPELHWGDNSARILFPPLGKDPSEKKVVDLLAAVVTGSILDVDDLDDLNIRRKCLFVKTSYKTGRKKTLEIVQKDYPSWEILVWDDRQFSSFEVDRILSTQIAKDNLDLDKQSLWESILPQFNISPDDLEDIKAKVLDLAPKIDAIESVSDTFDHILLINSILLYLAKNELEECLDFISQLLDGSEHEKTLALTGAKFLFKTFMHQVSSEDNQNNIIRLLLFAQITIKRTQNWDLIKVVLSAMDKWLMHEINRRTPFIIDVGEFSINRAIKSEGKLNLSYTIAANVPINRKQDLMAFLADWVKDHTRNEAIKDLAKQILTFLGLGSNTQLPVLSPDERFGLVFIGAKSVKSQLDPSELLQSVLNEFKETNFYPVVFKPGRAFPLAVGHDEQQIENISLEESTSFQPPSLLAPALEQIPVEKIGFVLVLNEDEIIDRDEWLGESIREACLFDNPHLQKSQDWPRFNWPDGTPGEKKEGAEIAHYVLKRMKG